MMEELYNERHAESERLCKNQILFLFMHEGKHLNVLITIIFLIHQYNIISEDFSDQKRK